MANLAYKIAQTKPGRFANTISLLLSDCTCAIKASSPAGEEFVWQLLNLRDWLAEKAMEEVREEARDHVWVREIDRMTAEKQAVAIE